MPRGEGERSVVLSTDFSSSEIFQHLMADTEASMKRKWDEARQQVGLFGSDRRL